MNPLRICQLNFADHGGGAERIAALLHQAYRQRGCDASLYVGLRRGTAPAVQVIDHASHRSAWARIWWRWGQHLESRGRWTLGKAGKTLARPQWGLRRMLGRDDHDQPGTAAFLDALRRNPPDIIHAHNLHGGYFDLRQLPALCRIAPLVITLHDEWLVSDGPAYVDMPGPQRRAEHNRQLKRAIYERCGFRLAPPSRWMLNRVEPNLPPSAVVESRCIPYGIDTTVFHPPATDVDAAAERQSLGLTADSFAVLFVGQVARSNNAKDFDTVREAVRRAADVAPQYEWTLLVLGDAGPDEPLGQARLKWLGSCAEPQAIAACYRAADVLAHAAHVENFPVVVLEAMACGRPVVATDVGGIGEQIDDGRTGRLVPYADPAAMGEALLALARDPAGRAAMGAAARDVAIARFGLDRMVNTYLDWFEQIATTRSS